MDWNLWEAIIRVLVSLPIICLAAWLFIKYGLSRSYPSNYGSLRVMEQVHLTPKASMSIVKVEEQYLLVSATEHQVTVIRAIDGYQPPEPRTFPIPLNDSLKRFRAGRGRRHES